MSGVTYAGCGLGCDLCRVWLRVWLMQGVVYAGCGLCRVCPQSACVCVCVCVFVCVYVCVRTCTCIVDIYVCPKVLACVLICVLVCVLICVLVCVLICVLVCGFREQEVKLQKQKATKEYVQEFLKRQEEVCGRGGRGR